MGTFSGYLLNALSVIINVLSVPISLAYFGAVRFGAMAVANSLLAYLSVTYFGIPNAVNVLAAKALDTTDQLKVIIKSFLLIAMISALVLAAFIVMTLSPHWIDLLGKIPEGVYEEVRGAIFVSAILFIVNVPLSIFLHGFSARQKVHLLKTYNSVSSFLTFLSLLASVWLGGTLVYYAFLRGVAVILVNIVAAVHLLTSMGVSARNLVSNVSQFLTPSGNAEFSISSITRTSSRFFLVYLAGTIVWSTDNLVISHILGVEAVTPYTITFRLITMTYVMFSAFNEAISPAFSKTYSTGDYQWIEKVYNKMIIILPVLGGLVWIGGVSFSRDIINLWVGPSGYGGLLMAFSIGGHGYLCAVNSAPVNLGNSLNHVFVSMAIAEAVANFLFSVLLIKYLGSGGVALGTFLGTLLTVFWISPLYIYRKMDKKIRFNYGPSIKHFFVILLPLLICVLLVQSISLMVETRVALNLSFVCIYLFLSYVLFKKDVNEVFVYLKNK